MSHQNSEVYNTPEPQHTSTPLILIRSIRHSNQQFIYTRNRTLGRRVAFVAMAGEGEGPNDLGQNGQDTNEQGQHEEDNRQPDMPDEFGITEDEYSAERSGSMEDRFRWFLAGWQKVGCTYQEGERKRNVIAVLGRRLQLQLSHFDLTAILRGFIQSERESGEPEVEMDPFD